MDIREKIKQIPVNQIIDYMVSIQSELQRYNDKELVFRAICHNSDKYKLYYYTETKSFFCYSECGAIDIFELTEKALNLDKKEAFKYVLRYFNINTSLSTDIGEWEEVEEYKPTPLNEIEIAAHKPIYNQKLMRLFSTHYPKEWLNEGISKEAMDKFNIKYDIKNKAIVIPHNNYKGQVCGIRVRNLDEDKCERYGKYHPLYLDGEIINHKLGENLYGLDKNIDNIRKYKKVVIFESEKSVLLMESYFKQNNISVAICGSSFSKYHQALLLSLGVEEIILALDKEYNNEEKEEKYAKKIERMVKQLKEEVKVTKVWDSIDGLLDLKESPIDRGISVYKTLISKRRDI